MPSWIGRLPVSFPTHQTGADVSQQPLSRVLSQELTLRCTDPRGRHHDLDAYFGYDPADPFAVTITFRTPRGNVQWVIARDLLSIGLTDPAGHGDVRLWPSIDDDGRAVVVLDFNSPDGRMLVHAHTHEVYRFVTRTLAAVPAGTEHVDLDLLVDVLMGRSEAQ